MNERAVLRNSEAALRALEVVDNETSHSPYDIDMDWRLANALLAAQSLHAYIARTLKGELTEEDYIPPCPCQRCGDEQN